MRPDRESTDPLTRIEAKVDGLEKLLNGNGRLGIAGKVQVLWGGAIFLVGGIILAALGLLTR